MKRGLILSLLMPALLMAQEAPTSAPTSEPTSAPTSEPTSTSMPSTLAALTQPIYNRQPVTLNRYPTLSYRLSLYPTLVGYAGTLTFATTSFLTENRATFRPIWLSFGALALVGPSIGHFYTGEYVRGVRLLARRMVVPGLLAITGTTVVLVSGGASAITGFDGNQDGVGRGALLGLIIGSAIVSYSIPSITIMSGRHIRDAKKAPKREAKEKNIGAPPEKRPAP